MVFQCVSCCWIQDLYSFLLCFLLCDVQPLRCPVTWAPRQKAQGSDGAWLKSGLGTKLGSEDNNEKSVARPFTSFYPNVQYHVISCDNMIASILNPVIWTPRIGGCTTHFWELIQILCSEHENNSIPQIIDATSNPCSIEYIHFGILKFAVIFGMDAGCGWVPFCICPQDRNGFFCRTCLGKWSMENIRVPGCTLW